MDPKKNEDFVQSEDWVGQVLDLNFIEVQNDTAESDPQVRSNSLSGNERNRLFLASHGYADMSLLSGADCQEDGRGFALWDYDGDGFQDIALINPQAPRVRVFHNDMAQVLKTSAGRIALKLVGGNDSAKSNPKLSNRDAVGAKVIVTDAEGNKRMFQKSIGEGFSSQNSAWIWIGMGEAKSAHHIEVVWPSGKKQSLEEVATGSKIQVREASGTF